MRYGAFPEDWFNLDLLGYGADLLPVVSNPNAPVSPRSTLKQIGKVPSRYNAQRQIVGIADWTSKKATAKELDMWAKEEDYGICLQTREIRALDIDVTDKKLAWDIVEFIGSQLDWMGLPIRTRNNSSKCLMAFRLPGDMPKRVMKVENGIIEFLATGQQFIAHGQHPSGVPYEWDWCEHTDFPTLSLEEFEKLWAALVQEFAIEVPSESSLRNAANGESTLGDAVSEYLEEHNYVTGMGKEGQRFLRCPFEHEHSEPSAPDGTSTAYFPPSRGYEQGHWACLHAHCHNRPEEDFLDAIGYRLADFDVLPQLTDADENVSKDKTAKNRFTPIQAGEFALREPPGWLIDEIIPKAEFGILFGATGTFKSFIAIDMGICIATGRPWNGREVKKGKVIYVCAEGSGNFKLRLRAIARHYDLDLSKVDFHVIEAAPSLLIKEDITELLRALKPYGACAMIFIDTWAQTTPGGDENSGKDMSRALGNIRLISKATKAIVMAVHHAGKDLTRGARGWSGLKAAADVELELIAAGKLSSSLTVSKQKDGETGLTWLVQMQRVELDPFNDKPLSSLIVTYETNIKQQNYKPKVKGFWQEKILEALDALGSPALEVGVTDWALAHGLARDMTLDKYGKLKTDRRRDLCRQALKTLVQAKEVSLHMGTITRSLDVE
jgi:hypothetical protein